MALDSATCWLLVAVGMAPCAIGQVFVDQTGNCALQGMAYTGAIYGTGIVCGDFDGDGDQDLIVAGDVGQSLVFYRNLGGLQFQDDTAISGLGTITGEFHGLTAADIDNDNDLDLFVCNWFGPALMWINQGTGVFTEQAAARGMSHTAASYSANFGDYDRDGWLDLYIGNREPLVQGGPLGSANMLYRNIGAGVFQDVTTVAGVGDVGLALASAFMDYNEDGWPDILVINDKGWSGSPNNLYENNGDGTFTSVAAAVGANIAIDGMGVNFADVFCDGGIDFFATDSGLYHLFMHWDAGLQRYVDATVAYGMLTNWYGWDCQFFDYDNDGWEDLLVIHHLGVNALFRNPGSPAAAYAPWTDVAATTGLANLYSQFSTVVADFDNDGRLDLCHRYSNQPPVQAPYGLGLMQGTGPTGKWLKFRTVGTVSNRDGIGARVDLHLGSHVQRRWVRTGVGYQSSSDLRLHFGLGAATVADKVVVTWPSGQVQQLDSVAANQIIEIVEPSMTLAGPVTIGSTSTLTMSIPTDAGLPYVMLMSHADSPRSQLPDGRFVPLAFDWLSGYTFVPGNALIPNSLGWLDSFGSASTPLQIPNNSVLSGLTLYATGASFEATGILQVRTIFPTAVTIAIQ